jgi:tryptophan-rich sensory protein
MPAIMHTSAIMKSSQLLALAGFLPASFAAAAVGGWATATGRRSWYQALAKPAWNPPDAVFGPVWTILFLMMSVAVWRVWLRREESGSQMALVAFFVQLGLNVAWSVLFFGFRRPGLAFGEILVFWGMLAWMLARFWSIDHTAGFLWLPYFLWVTFAVWLNLAIWKLNP